MNFQNQSFYLSGSSIVITYVFVLIAMFFGANLSLLLWGSENMSYVLALPLSLGIVYLFLSVKFKKDFKILMPHPWLLVWTISLILFVTASIFGYQYRSSIHFMEWNVARSAFLVNIFLIYIAYIASRYYPGVIFKALVIACKAGIWLTAFTFVLYLISTQTGILPDRLMIYYNEASLPFMDVTFPRFGGLFKEPAEASFFLIFSAIVLYVVGSNFYAYTAIFMGLFLGSNAFWLLLFGVLGLYLAFRHARKIIVPVYLFGVLVTVIFFIVIEPDASYFIWLDLLLPRAANLYGIGDEPQRLWTNWVAVQDFIRLRWPLGGGAGFIRAFGADYYLFTREAIHGAGAGVFKFLSDFGLIGLLLLFAGCIKFHKFLLAYKGKTMLAVAAILCVLFMSIRTGYYNISVWTCFFAVLAYTPDRHVISKQEE